MFALFRRQTLALTRRELQVGVVLGVLYGVAQVLQTTGLAHTDASVSGFITGTYVVLTPVLGAVLLHDRIGRVTWFAVGLATAGAGAAVAAGLLGRHRRGADPAVGDPVRRAHRGARPLVDPGGGGRPRHRAGRRHHRRRRGRGRARRAHPARRRRPVGLAALHGARRRRAGPVGADLGAGPPHGDPGGDRHGARAGVRGAVRRDPRRREPDRPDARRRRARRGRDVPRRAAVDAARPGRRPRPTTHRSRPCTTTSDRGSRAGCLSRGSFTGCRGPLCDCGGISTRYLSPASPDERAGRHAVGRSGGPPFPHRAADKRSTACRGEHLGDA